MNAGEIKIVTQHGFVYELVLNKEEGRTQITGGDWDDLIEHYGVYYYDQIIVNLDGDHEFFRVTVFGANNKEKMIISEPGCNIYPLYARS